jgi:uncharacterized protein YciI
MEAMKRYLVLVLRNPSFDEALLAAHARFLSGLRSRSRIELAGPFADRSGGAYLLRADSMEEARALAEADPLHASGASRVVVHEWEAA